MATAVIENDAHVATPQPRPLPQVPPDMPEDDAPPDEADDIDVRIPLDGFGSRIEAAIGASAVKPYPPQDNDEWTHPVPPEALFGHDEFLPDDGRLDALAGELLAHYALPAGQAGEIEYLWKRKGGLAKGRVRTGAIQRPSGLLAHYCKASFVVWLAADHLRESHATYRTVRAALFHELSHVEPDDRDGHEGEYVLVGPEFAGFGAEIRAFGLWFEGLKAAEQAIAAHKQLALDLEGADANADDTAEE